MAVEVKESSDVFEADITVRSISPKSSKYLMQILKLRSAITEQLAIIQLCYITMNHVKRIPSDGLSDSFIVKVQHSSIAFSEVIKSFSPQFSPPGVIDS